MAKPHILFSCSELVTHIFTFLDYKDILHMQSVCKVFHAATADPALDDHLFRTARPGDENRLVESITDINKVRLHPIFSHLSWFDKLQCIVVLADSRRSITRSRLGALKESITVPPVKTLNMAWQDPRAENCRGVCTIRNDTGVTLKQYLKELEERLKGPLYDEDPAEIPMLYMLRAGNYTSPSNGRLEVEWYLTPERNEEPSRLKVAYDRVIADFGYGRRAMRPS